MSKGGPAGRCSEERGPAILAALADLASSCRLSNCRLALGAHSHLSFLSRIVGTAIVIISIVDLALGSGNDARLCPPSTPSPRYVGILNQVGRCAPLFSFYVCGVMTQLVAERPLRRCAACGRGCGAPRRCRRQLSKPAAALVLRRDYRLDALAVGHAACCHSISEHLTRNAHLHFTTAASLASSFVAVDFAF